MKFQHIVIVTLLFSSCLQTFAADQTPDNERFQTVAPAIVVDTHSGLMWASQDNGKAIDWYDAERYCDDFEAGGYTDWRLPDMEELTTLYTPDRKSKDGYFITDAIRMSDCCLWSSDTNMGGASIFSYTSGKESVGSLHETYQLRALPVRSTKETEPHE